MMRTESQKKSSDKYVKKTIVQLTVKCHIDKFELLMNSTEPGEGRLVSEGISSELAPRAVWKLSVDPNGNLTQRKGNISVFLWLTGPMPPLQKDNGETLDANYHLYLVDASGNTDSIERGTFKFGKEGFHINHDRAKKALQADGSLLVAADIDFFAPHDGSAKVISDRARRHALCQEAQGGMHQADCQRRKRRLRHRRVEGAGERGVNTAGRQVLHRWTQGPSGEALHREAMSEENIVALAVLACTHSAEKLKEACVKLIASEGKTMFKSTAWKDLRETKPQIALDLAQEATRVLAEKLLRMVHSMMKPKSEPAAASATEVKRKKK